LSVAYVLNRLLEISNEIPEQPVSCLQTKAFLRGVVVALYMGREADLVLLCHPLFIELQKALPPEGLNIGAEEEGTTQGGEGEVEGDRERSNENPEDSPCSTAGNGRDSVQPGTVEAVGSPQEHNNQVGTGPSGSGLQPDPDMQGP
jgi:hypothetical protein